MILDKSLLIVVSIFCIILFQNCGQNFKILEDGQAGLSSSQPESDILFAEKNIYANKCATCHGSFAISNLKNRIITKEKITNATNSITAMRFLKGALSEDQLAAIERLFAQPPTSSPLISSFECTSPEEEKNSSIDLIRLSGKELINTYKTLIPSTIWSNLSPYTYLLPTDSFSNKISTALSSYSQSQITRVSEFNDKLSSEITSTTSKIAAFFGSCASTTSFTKSCFDSFMNAKASRIYRSALATDELSTTWDAISTLSPVNDQLKTLIQILFNDPRFLYHLEIGDGSPTTNGLYPLSSYEIANRISYGMLESPPDDALWNDAVAGRLKSLPTISAHVDRMANSQSFQARIIQFMKFYIGKSPTNPPASAEFLNGLNTSTLGADLETEFEDFIRYIVFTKKGNLSELFTSPAAFPKTSAVASIFGTSTTSSSTPVEAPNHSGIITRPFFVLATSPNVKSVQRGRAIRMNMLCTDIPQPSAEDLAARPTLTESDLLSLSSRHYIDKATLAAPSCIVCHSKMNQLGFTLGHYDSVGRFMTVEGIYNSSGTKVANHVIDSTTKPMITEIDNSQFAGAMDFQNSLYRSDVLQQCMTTKAFEFFSRQVANVSMDSCRLNKMDNAIKSGKSLFDFFNENFKQPSILYRRGN
tara:strand:- start:2260 stop:4197 length:1938 start_codon:yes stop_codon:yes gene_type:complete